MTMDDTMNFKVQCILVFFAFCMQEGLSKDYEANLGADYLLQVYIYSFYLPLFLLVSEVIGVVKPG